MEVLAHNKRFEADSLRRRSTAALAVNNKFTVYFIQYENNLAKIHK